MNPSSNSNLLNKLRRCPSTVAWLLALLLGFSSVASAGHFHSDDHEHGDHCHHHKVAVCGHDHHEHGTCGSDEDPHEHQCVTCLVADLPLVIEVVPSINAISLIAQQQSTWHPFLLYSPASKLFLARGPPASL